MWAVGRVLLLGLVLLKVQRGVSHDTKPVDFAPLSLNSLGGGGYKSTIGCNPFVRLSEMGPLMVTLQFLWVLARILLPSGRRMCITGNLSPAVFVSN